MRDMDYQQLVSHFGGLSKAAGALGLDRRRVHAWRDLRIPSKWQLKVERLTSGKLTADKQAKREGAEFVALMSKAA